MEQRLDATYLHPGPFQRAGAIGIGAVSIGAGILLAAWGISFLWRYTPPEMVVRIANPELHVSQNGPFTVTQDKPFTLAQPEPLKIEPGQITVKTEQAFSPVTSGVGGDTKTPTGDVIRREVTVFSEVKHEPGRVVTGWNYKDGGGGVPVRQYCYYDSSNVDRSSTWVEIALNGVRTPHANISLVPDLQGALAKCQWWQG
jgi:hypothetical protein